MQFTSFRFGAPLLAIVLLATTLQNGISVYAVPTSETNVAVLQRREATQAFKTMELQNFGRDTTSLQVRGQCCTGDDIQQIIAIAKFVFEVFKNIFGLFKKKHKSTPATTPAPAPTPAPYDDYHYHYHPPPRHGNEKIPRRDDYYSVAGVLDTCNGLSQSIVDVLTPLDPSNTASDLSEGFTSAYAQAQDLMNQAYIAKEAVSDDEEIHQEVLNGINQASTLSMTLYQSNNALPSYDYGGSYY